MTAEDDDEEWLSAYQAGTQDFRHGWDTGWEEAYKEMERRDWRYTPPWFRRFFWHPLDSFCEKPSWFIRHKVAQTDEHCNPVFGIRLKGGVLYVRFGWRVRNVDSPPCKVCEAEGVGDVPASRQG